jgi:hypothetical protein
LPCKLILFWIEIADSRIDEKNERRVILLQSTKENSTQENTTTMTVNNKIYIVKSVFIGNKNIKDTLIKIAEKKSLEEMGLA